VQARRHMVTALALGRRGLGKTWPNPSVGCVLVRDGRIVGRGWTQPGGRPHAEVMALAQAGPLAKGADVFVTLEPCAHHGESPPCAQALIDAGVSRVFVGAIDPDPRVAGKGLQMLRAAGIEVLEGVEPEASAEAHAGFFCVQGRGRPFLTLKLATSLDGRIATASGESRWITGPAARRLVHGMRNSHDAVLVGGGTARSDNPDLRVRGFGTVRQPVRVVASRHLGIDPAGRLGQTAREAPVWLVHGAGEGDTDARTQSAWEECGARLVAAEVGASGQLDPLSVLEALAARGMTRVFCEGGGALAASLLMADLVDQVVTFTAGLSIGAEGRPALGALGLDRLAEAHRFDLRSARRVGDDVCQIWRRQR